MKKTVFDIRYAVCDVCSSTSAYAEQYESVELCELHRPTITFRQFFEKIIICISYTKRLCIFGPKGAIHIRFYYYYYMHPFLRHSFLGQDCAYYMQDFTVLESVKLHCTYVLASLGHSLLYQMTHPTYHGPVNQSSYCPTELCLLTS